MTHPLGTQRFPEVYQGTALLAVNKGSNSLHRGRSKHKINRLFKAAVEEKRRNYNGKSIVKQSASADLSVDELADEEGKCSHYDASISRLVLGEIYGTRFTAM